jgi:NAD(P)-dependent dehydrogenase (short-subunit alcohol dehydrogenase family)
MVLSPVDMKGKVCVVTGATSGIGWVTAYRLSQWGAAVVLMGRDVKRGLAAVDRIQKECGNGNSEFIRVDLAAQQEIRQFVEEFKKRYDRLDILVNNAGTTLLTRRMSVDGYEMTFVVNHLSHFLLTNLLIDVLKTSAPSRVINVSSGSHRRASINFDDLHSQSGYRIMRAYGQSKLANILFTYELARQLEGTGVTANALHPGFVLTNLGRDNGWLIHRIIRLAMRMKGISPEEGAQTILYLAASPEVEGVTGKYFYKMKPVKSSPKSYDPEASRRLWEISEKLTGLTVS